MTNKSGELIASKRNGDDRLNMIHGTAGNAHGVSVKSHNHQTSSNEGHNSPAGDKMKERSPPICHDFSLRTYESTCVTLSHVLKL